MKVNGSKTLTRFRFQRKWHTVLLLPHFLQLFLYFYGNFLHTRGKHFTKITSSWPSVYLWLLFVRQAEWVWCLNQTIARALLDEKKAVQSQPVAGSLVLLPPPRDRHSSFAFSKAGPLKDAQYKGMWRSGKIHGQ